MPHTPFSALVAQLRTPNAVPPFVAFFIGYAFSFPSYNAMAIPLIGGLCIVLLMFYGTLQNDSADYELDKSAHRATPFVTGQLSRQTLTCTAYTCLVVAILLAIGSRNATLCVSVLVSVLLYSAYNLRPIRTAARPIASIITIALLLATIPFLTGYLITGSQLSAPVILFASGLFFYRFSISLLKDYKDYKEDKLFNKTTFLLRYESVMVRLISIITSITGFCLIFAALLPTVSGLLSWGITLVLILLACIMMSLRSRLGSTLTSLKANAKIFQQIFEFALVFDIGVFLCLYMS